VIRQLAISVSNSRLTCATEEPNSVGTISFITLRTSGAAQPQRGQDNRPSFASAGSCTTSCSTPEIRIAQAMAVIGTWKYGAHHSAAAIMHRFMITGTSAGMAKRWKVLSTAPAIAVSEMKSRKGKVMRSRSAVSWNFAGSSCEPGANRAVTCGANSTPSAVTTSSTAPRVPATRAIIRRSSSGVPFSFISVSAGTKAVEKEPSANSRRMKLGMRKATQKASVAALAPKTLANTTSRTSPRTRETKVPALKLRVERSRLGRVKGGPRGRGGAWFDSSA
jgi:hypothetical protein